MKSFWFGQDVHGAQSYLASTAHTSTTTNACTCADDRLDLYPLGSSLHIVPETCKIQQLYTSGYLISQSWNVVRFRSGIDFGKSTQDITFSRNSSSFSLMGERQNEKQWKNIRVHGLYLSEDWNLLLGPSKGFRK